MLALKSEYDYLLKNDFWKSVILVMRAKRSRNPCKVIVNMSVKTYNLLINIIIFIALGISTDHDFNANMYINPNTHKLYKIKGPMAAWAVLQAFLGTGGQRIRVQRALDSIPGKLPFLGCEFKMR